MTVTEFKDKHGPAFKVMARTACFIAFVQTLKDAHPLKLAAQLKDNQLLAGAPVYLNNILGFEAALEVVARIQADAPVVAEDPESTYIDT